MEIAITVVALAAVLLLAMAAFTILWPPFVGVVKALIRRDPGGVFVPHSQLLWSRWLAGFYTFVALTMLVMMQPLPFQKPKTTVEFSLTGSPDLQQRVSRLVAPRVAAGDAIGVVVGVVDPSGIQVFGFGQRGLGAHAPDGTTVFEMGEITRTFTTLLLARMAEH